MSDETPHGERALSFGARADAYDRVRPEYPAEAARWLVPGSPRLVVELGAGTGKLTRALAALALRVLAVEPDGRMRAVLAARAPAGVEAVDGSAEAIPAGDGSADAVVAGSAFHWFDLPRTLDEVARVLVPGGTLAFAWNRRDDRSPAIRRASEAMRGGEGGGGPAGRDWPAELAADGRFEPLEHSLFPHTLTLPRASLEDYACSYSRVALLPPAERAQVVAAVRAALESAPGLLDGDLVRLPFVVTAYRTRRRS